MVNHMKRLVRGVFLLGVIAALYGCGYHMAGHSNALPKSIHVVSDPNGGDAVLRGKVISLEVTPLLFQTTPGTLATATTPATASSAQATAMLVTIKCEVTL